jgi:hypothetical protein
MEDKVVSDNDNIGGTAGGIGMRVGRLREERSSRSASTNE